MASVYAASSIHSKSTLSKKYDVDTSAMFGGGGGFGGEQSQTEKSEFNALVQAFTLDIGRCDLPYPWINTLRLFIFPFFMIINSFGSSLIHQTKVDGITAAICRIIEYVTIFNPDSTSFTLSLAVSLSFLIMYFAFCIFLLYLVKLYAQSNCPSITNIYFFIITSRVIVPLFTTFSSHMFSNSLCGIIFASSAGSSSNSYFLVMGIAMLIVQIVIIFFGSSLYNATPIIRPNDKSQPWFSHSKIDWQLNIVLFVQIFIKAIASHIEAPVSTILYMIVIIIMSVLLGGYCILRLPFIFPNTNAVVLASAMSCPFCSMVPLIAHYKPSYTVYVILGVIVITVLLFFLGRLFIQIRMKKIIDNFGNLADTNNTESEPMDALTAAFLQINPTRAVEFAKLGLKNETEMSLYLRVGFLFSQQEVVNHLFIKWSTDQNIKADLVLSACQVTYALQSDVRMMNTLEQYCHQLGSAPYNSRSFVLLFNHLRQELLTQLNQPLLEAVGRAKKANNVLQTTISEFWSAVLKQKLDTLRIILPQIALEFRRADNTFQQLIRNYPKSSTVFREASLFYHKSAGDHHMSLQCQKNYTRSRNQVDSGSASGSETESSTFTNVDNEFRDRIEPWIAAQDSIQSLPSSTKSWLYTAIIMGFALMFFVPLVILIIGTMQINTFQEVLDPIQTVGDIEHTISRIPQLARRMHLWKTGEVHPPADAVGHPVNTLLEFVDDKAINQSLVYYHGLLTGSIDAFYDLCGSEVIYDKCRAQSVHVKVGDDISNNTIYDVLNGYSYNLEHMISGSNGFAWDSSSTSSEMIYLFENFNALYEAISDVLHDLMKEIEKNDKSFDVISYGCIGVIWGSAVIIIVPLVIIALMMFLKEMSFNLKLFFQIPKSEISQLRWSTKSKKNGQENNAQRNYGPQSTENSSSLESSQFRNEEMAETLATVPRQSSGLFGAFLIVFFAFVLFTCIMTTFGILVFRNSMKGIVEMSNAYVSAIEVSSCAVASYVWTQEVWAKDPILYDNDYLKVLSTGYFKQFHDLFSSFLYGSEAYNNPALLLGDDVISKFMIGSEGRDVKVSDHDPLYGVIHDVYSDMSCESMMHTLDRLSRFSLSTASDLLFNFDDDFVYHYEHILFGHLDNYLMEGRNLFHEKTTVMNRDKTQQLVLVFLIMFVVQLIFFFTVVVTEFRKLVNCLFTTRMLMGLIAPESLLKSQTFVKWLSGIYTMRTRVYSNDSGNVKTNGEFSVNYSKCGLLIMDENATIVRANNTALSLFKLEEAEMQGMKYVALIEDILIDSNKEYLLHELKKQIRKMKEGFSKTNKHTVNASVIGTNGQLCYISMILEGHSDEAEGDFEDNEALMPAHSFTCVIVDRTTEHFQEGLIEAEKKKSENLLNSIVPAVISKKLQEGEQDVSFDVPKATILFASIASWHQIIIGKSPSEVINILNSLFTAFDDEILKHRNLTKIKSMGHTYLAVSGLFCDSNVNTAQLATDFALSLMEVAERIGSDLGIPLQITIGLHTGGPINAGVIGSTRAVFDIVGEPVSIASKMNAACLAGYIQISEATYEEIKFLKYNIKERGEMNARGKSTTKTYMISPLSASYTATTTTDSVTE